MKLISITNLIGGGLNSDITPVDMGGNYLTHCNNVRMKSGGITPFGGSADVADVALVAEPHYMKFVKGVDADKWIIAGKDKIVSYSASFTDISPSNMTPITDSDSWTITSISGITIVNHPVLGPMYMDVAHSTLTPLPWKTGADWASAKQKCNIMVVHRQFMFALGLIDNGIEIPDGVRWSAPADVGAVPKNWDPLDNTSTAGIMSLGGSGGRIIGALSLRDSLAVYREYGITMFDYVGGQYVWRARRIGTDVGLLSKDAVADVNGTHFFLTYGDVYVNDGNTTKSIASDKIIKRLSAIDKHNYNRAFALHNAANKEVWFCVPTTGYEYANKAFIFNYEYGSWLVRDLPNIMIADTGSLTSADTIWDNSHITWDGAVKSWGDNATSPFDIMTLGLRKESDTAYKISAIDLPLGFNSNPYSSIIERTDLAIGGIGVTNTITRIYPHVTGASKVRVQVGSQMAPGGPVQWKPFVDFSPSDSRKIDIRSTGLLHAYRIMATDVTANFILTGLDFEYTEAGTR